MKNSPGVIHHSSRNHYLKSRNPGEFGKPTLMSQTKSNTNTNSKIGKKLENGLRVNNPSDEVIISRDALDKQKEIKEPDIKKLRPKTEISNEKIDQPREENDVKKGLNKAKETLEKGALSLSKLSNTPGIPLDISLPIHTNQIEEIPPLADLDQGLPNDKNKNLPLLVFINGLKLGGLSSDEDGIQNLASQFENGKIFGWSKEDEIIEEIMTRSPDAPIILVGHSLGGDTAVAVANRLNRIENKFRQIELLVTMDSLGFNNDIIPRNVKTNLNFVGDNDFILSDGPNIARDSLQTKVINELVKEDHTKIDDSNEVQFKIYKQISEILDGAPKKT